MAERTEKPYENQPTHTLHLSDGGKSDERKRGGDAGSGPLADLKMEALNNLRNWNEGSPKKPAPGDSYMESLVMESHPKGDTD